MKRILYVSSVRWPWFESQSSAEHFAEAPYSIDAVGFNLEKLGWTVGWCGWKGSRNPLALAKRIDEFKPDVAYTYGSTVALHPLFCRKFLCRHKAFKVVHGWDDHYGRIWGDLFGWPGKVFMNWMEKRIVKNSDAVVTLSYELQKIGWKWGVEEKSHLLDCLLGEFYGSITITEINDNAITHDRTGLQRQFYKTYLAARCEAMFGA